MATTKDVTLKTSKLAPAKQDNSLKGMLSNDNIKNRFNEILGKNSAAFISSLLAVANNNELLMKSDHYWCWCYGGRNEFTCKSEFWVCIYYSIS